MSTTEENRAKEVGMTEPGEVAHEWDVVAALSAAARQLDRSREDEATTLSLIVSGAVQTIPGAEYAGVSLLYRDGGISSAATSDATVDKVDRLQAEYREGPCVTALWDQHTVIVEDLAVETDRWPRFAAQAAAQGVGSMLSFQLFAQNDSMGALNLYSGTPHNFSADSRLLGGLFAGHAATALGETRHVAQLQEALSTRDVIGQAKGMLMERFGLDADQAFQLLVRSSQDANMKLVRVAQWLTDTAAGLPDQQQ